MKKLFEKKKSFEDMTEEERIQYSYEKECKRQERRFCAKRFVVGAGKAMLVFTAGAIAFKIARDHFDDGCDDTTTCENTDIPADDDMNDIPDDDIAADTF